MVTPPSGVPVAVASSKSAGSASESLDSPSSVSFRVATLEAAMGSSKDQLIANAAAILREEGASAVFLFGSFAEGRERPDSDLDLAVSGLPASRFFAALSGAADAAGRPIDLVDLDEDTPFCRYLRSSPGLRRVA